MSTWCGAVARLKRGKFGSTGFIPASVSELTCAFFHSRVARYTLRCMSNQDARALRTYRAFAIRGKEDSEIIELPLRAPARDEIRIKVAYVGICGSDLHYYFDGANGRFVIQEPLIPGHELSGVIDEDPLGEFAPGALVTVFPAQGGEPIAGLADRPHLWRGVRYLGSAATSPHTQGALAEYLYVKREMVRVLPPNLSLQMGVLAEPLAVSMHGLELAGSVAGKRVLISGSGPIGLLTIVAVKDAGAAHIAATDIVDQALARALRMGADEVINVNGNTLPVDSYDVVFECSGSTVALNAALNSVQRGGVIIQVGMISGGAQPIEIGLLGTKEVRLIGAFRFNDQNHEMENALALLSRHPELAECITHNIALDDAVSAFLIAGDAAQSAKVVIAF